MKGKSLLLLTLSLLLVLGLGGGIEGLWAREPEALGEGPLLGSPVGTAFTYQGRLIKDGSPVNASCDFQFSLWDAVSGGTQVGTTQTKTVSVSNGLFTVTDLDFGAGAFQGDARWLQIAVRCPTGSGNYTPLDPRQALTPAPYALALPGLWTQPNATSPNLIGGYSGNSVTSGVVGATISGGGASGSINSVTDNYGTVGGGDSNTASGYYATVGGGTGNTASGQDSIVGGGSCNTASGQRATVGGGYQDNASGYYATVGGGSFNTASNEFATVSGGRANKASGMDATVGGGQSNTASNQYATVGGGGSNIASGDRATVGGGGYNTASTQYATVGGGYWNTASQFATVGGGGSNIASGNFATVPGGYQNTAQGGYSFAAGRRAKANNQGCFVWGDSNDADLDCYADNLTIFRSSGGYLIYTNTALSTGAYLAANSGTWSSVSDRNVKENIVAVDAQDVLERLARVPLSTWNYIGEEEGIHHMGPMAEDFYAAFGLGDSERHITTIDADGVALAAIQGLYEMMQEKEAQIAAQQEQIEDLEARVAALEGLVAEGRAPAHPLQSGVSPWWGILLAGVGLVWLARRGDRR